MTTTRLLLVAGATMTFIGCSPVDSTAPERDPGGTSDLTPGRRVRRLTADQFHRSLQIATGQSWSRYAERAAALGRADFAETTDEGTDFSVTFDKLVHDAARESCKRAVAADRSGADVILRHAGASDRGKAELFANVRYLVLRFLGFAVDDGADPRVAPWLALLRAGRFPMISDDEMALRWEAVCIGLVTHPDFLTY
jgi:hypothetical protein